MDPAAMVRAVLRDSLAAVPAVAALDRAHAVTKLQTPGSTAAAPRKPAADGCVAMRALLIDRLARGAVLTAALWESALPTGVDFSAASDLQFSDMVGAEEYVVPR